MVAASLVFSPRTKRVEASNARKPTKGKVYEELGWGVGSTQHHLHHRAAFSGGAQGLDHIFTTHGSQDFL